jgi:hypothetical protein
MLSAIASVALLMSGADAQHDHHCYTPPNFGADAMIRHHEDGGRHDDFGVRAHFWQDGERHRVATYEIVEDHRDQEDKYHRIYFFHHDVHHPSGGVEFKINLNAKTCTREDLTREFRPLEIPQNATFSHQQYVGSSGERGGSILTNFFRASFQHRHGDARWEGLFTSGDIGCWPVEDIFEDRSDSTRSVTHTSYYNLVQGISDPSVFEVPSICFNDGIVPEQYMN